MRFARPDGVTLALAFTSVTITFFCLLICAPSSIAQQRFGAQSTEAEPGRRQQWLVPSPDQGADSHALLYRPSGDGPFRLAVIAHGSTQNALRRAQMLQPDYSALAVALVARGFAVLVPERSGHGSTGGAYLEDQGSCADANYLRAGRATAEAIRSAIAFMHHQPFIRAEGTLIVGHSAGAWGALALAASDPRQVTRIVAFAPGRGGHADDRPFAVCAEARLVATAGDFGRGARVPVTWLVAQNDTYFTPTVSKRMADAFGGGGDDVDFRILPATGKEGHWLAERDDVETIVPSLPLDQDSTAAKPRRN